MPHERKNVEFYDFKALCMVKGFSWILDVLHIFASSLGWDFSKGCGTDPVSVSSTTVRGANRRPLVCRPSRAPF
jgi:hypothetical protein